jgi:hypothetical protein
LVAGGGLVDPNLGTGTGTARWGAELEMVDKMEMDVVAFLTPSLTQMVKPTRWHLPAARGWWPGWRVLHATLGAQQRGARPTPRCVAEVDALVEAPVVTAEGAAEPCAVVGRVLLPESVR